MKVSKTSIARSIPGLNERLRAVRLDKNQTIAQFSQLLSISNRAYAAYESGERTAPSIVLFRITALCHINGHWLLTGEGQQSF